MALFFLLLLSSLQVDAQENGDLRLAGSSNPQAGRLEIFLRGQWGTVCSTFVFPNGDAARVACRQLGFFTYSTVSSAEVLGFDTLQRFSPVPIWLDNVNCFNTYTNLLSCFSGRIGENSCDHSDDIGVVCTGGLAATDLYAEGDVRLIDRYEIDVQGGRLEIFLRGEWGTVCDDGFGQTEADVVCRQLGFSLASRFGLVDDLGFTLSDSSSTMVWLDEVSCGPDDMTLLSCSHSGIGDVGSCTHFDDVAVMCFNETLLNGDGNLRLVSSSFTNAGAGRLEIFLRGEWGTVCDDGFGYAEADVACRQLGFPSYLAYDNVGNLGFPSASSFTEIWLDDVSCRLEDSKLLFCDHRGIGSHNCEHSQDIALICSYSTANTSTPQIFAIMIGLIISCLTWYS